MFIATHGYYLSAPIVVWENREVYIYKFSGLALTFLGSLKLFVVGCCYSR